MIRSVAVIGATGSIGANALQIIGEHPGRFRASVLVAHRNVEALAALCARHRPEIAIIADKTLQASLARRLAAAGVHCEVAGGIEAIAQTAMSNACDIVIAASAGFAGIASTLAAARAGKRLLLAHTESTVMAGPLLRQALAEGGGQLIPLDGRQSAIFQCLSGTHLNSDRVKLTLVDSGGVFRGRRRADLMTVGPEHLGPSPNRVSNPRVAVNAASLMDLGLGLIEAHHLFALPADRLDILLEPQQQVHAIVESAENPPPIRLRASSAQQAMLDALTWPDPMNEARRPLELPAGALPAFQRPDAETFRCPTLALQALQAGGDATTILNAANEVAVAAFLSGSVPFLSIADLIEQAMTELPAQPVVDIQTLCERDRAAREAVRRVLRNAC